MPGDQAYRVGPCRLSLLTRRSDATLGALAFKAASVAGSFALRLGRLRNLCISRLTDGVPIVSAVSDCLGRLGLATLHRGVPAASIQT